MRLRWRIGPGELVEAREHRVVDGVVTSAHHVHHRNGMTGDNRPENLLEVDHAEHGAEHRLFDRTAASDMYLGGMTLKQVGGALGVHHVTVLRALRSAGVAIRPKGSEGWTDDARERHRTAMRAAWERRRG